MRALFALALAACSGGPNATFDGYCMSATTALCAKFRECPQQGYPPPAQCPAFVMGFYCTCARQAIAAGKLTYHADKAQACLDYIKTSSCGEFSMSSPERPPCADVLGVTNAGQLACNPGGNDAGGDLPPGSACNITDPQTTMRCQSNAAGCHLCGGYEKSDGGMGQSVCQIPCTISLKDCPNGMVCRPVMALGPYSQLGAGCDGYCDKGDVPIGSSCDLADQQAVSRCAPSPGGCRMCGGNGVMTDGGFTFDGRCLQACTVAMNDCPMGQTCHAKSELQGSSSTGTGCADGYCK